MANHLPSVAASLPLRPLLDLARPPQRRTLAFENASAALAPETVWEVLATVAHQQLRQDALLLWRPARHNAQLELLAVTPPGGLLNPLAVTATGALADLLARRLEAVAHVHCAHSNCPLEQTLWQLGLHAGLTTALGTPAAPLLLTVGFRERWQLVAHHTPAVVALGAYLREVAEVCLPGPAAEGWWEAAARVPGLWRQPWRPSVLRTLHDLNEVLAEAAEGESPVADRPEARVSRLAHKAADLMARWESVYWDSRPTIATEELLAEALMLVRGAYHLGRDDWPGCLAAMDYVPQPAGTSPAALRHALVDWVLSQLAEEQDG